MGAQPDAAFNRIDGENRPKAWGLDSGPWNAAKVATVKAYKTMGIAAVGAAVVAGLALQPSPDKPVVNPVSEAPAPVESDPLRPGTLATADTPNVIVLVWDTVRADRMSLYGNEVSTTPWLDEWAGGARVYDTAVSPSFWTLPAHASLFTGTHVQTHGATWANRWLSDDAITMAEWFDASGYATFGWSTNPNVHPLRNTHQGFETFLSPFDEALPWRKKVLAATKRRLHPKDASTPASPRWKGKRKEVPIIAGGVARDALFSWMDGKRPKDKPFFAFVNLMEAHGPRLPTKVSRQSAMQNKTDLKRSFTVSSAPGRLRKATANARPYSGAQKRVLRSVYDASLMDLDRATRIMFEGLEERGALDNTIVVLTSDHGEAFGEHGYYRHNRGLHQEVVGVPLVVWYPKGLSPERVSRPVSTAEVFAALCELTGLEPPPVDGFMPSGLLKAIEAPVIADGRDPVGKRKRKDPEAMWQERMAIYSGDWKLISGDNGQDELYALKDDPTEQVNRAERQPEVVEALSQALATWQSSTPVQRANNRSGPPAGEQAMEGLLQTLGYIE